MSIDAGTPNAAAERQDEKERPAAPQHAVATDPVCGMRVDPAKAAGSVEHAGTRYYFCGRSCLEKFKAEPEKYLAPASAAPSHSTAMSASPKAPAESGIVWTCPMHPEVRRTGARRLPDLRHGARAGDADSAARPTNPELADMTRRFWFELALTRAADGAGHGGHAAGHRSEHRASLAPLGWVQLALATPVVLWGGGRSSTAAGIDGQPQPQHVHADRPRYRRRRTATARGGDSSRTSFPPRSAATAAASRSISKRRR